MFQSIKSSYLPAFGSPMPTRSWSDPNAKYKYGFNGKEKDNETSVDGGDYDFGARIYDSRLGRWLSLDPLIAKYPNITPYNFSKNSPNFFNDPNGMDAVITINNTGTNTGNTICVKTTVILYGPNAKDVDLKKLNESAAALGAPRTFKDETGKEWTITFEITFKYSPELTDYAKELDKNSNEYLALELSDQNRTMSKDMKEKTGYVQGDNILRVDNSEFPGSIKGNTGQGANGGASGNWIGSLLHETFHMIGYGDRYYGMTGIYEPDFFDDVVGGQLGGPKYIHPVHYIDLITFVRKEGSEVGSKTVTYGYFKLTLDNSCSGSPNCSKTEEEKKAATAAEIK